MSFLEQTPIRRTIEPNHIETALYAASVNLASARGVEVSRVRIFSPIIGPQGGSARVFDGALWTTFAASKKSVKDVLSHTPLGIFNYIVNENNQIDLVSWLHFDTADEQKESLGGETPTLLTMKGIPHEWSPVIGRASQNVKAGQPFTLDTMQTSPGEDGCTRCRLLKPGLRNFHAWIAADPTCQYCGEEWTGKNEGQACKGFAPLPACEYRLENFRESTI